MSKKFPRNIFQVWYQGCGNVEREDFKSNMENWRILNTEWKYQCIDGKELEKACKEYSDECHNVYMNAKNMHMKIDLGRYVMLYLNGGIYVDMDAFVMRGLDSSEQVRELIGKYEDEGLDVLGISQLNINTIESYVMFMRGGGFNNAIMMSSPRNPVLGRYIDRVVMKTKEVMESKMSDYDMVQKSTGPIGFNAFFGNDENTKETEIITFAPSVFEPCNFGNNCEITNQTLSVHMFEMSWLSKYMKAVSKLYYNIKANMAIILAIVVLVMITFRSR